MNDWKKIAVSSENTLLEVMQVIDKGVKQIALVIADDCHLLGTVTDGDIRRALLKGISLNSQIKECMNTNPVTGLINEKSASWQRSMQKLALRNLPILDARGCVVKLVQLELPQEPVRENHIIIMAGGLGSRLHPLTENQPKPLLKIGNKPILETIIQNIAQQGFYQFTLCINYHGDKIKNYFQDGQQFDTQIDYIEEEKRLGTAGALSLLKDKPEHPFIVMNGDILTKVDLVRLVEFHQQQQNVLTLCTREYQHQVPYGVVEHNEHKITSIKEKPMHFYNINAGIYILSPEVLDLIPHNQYFDMTQLIEQLLSKKEAVGSFPLTDYWMDIGQMDDFKQAHDEYDDNFR